MKKIRKIAILGAGAMGAYFAGRFFDTTGFSTVLIAKGERSDKLKKGLVINGTSYAIPVIHPDEAILPVDLIIVALKHHHLEEAVQGLEKLVGASTLIISVMNGLESEDYIGSIYGMDKMLYAISVAIDAVRQDNRITYTKPGKHYFGDAINTRLSQRVLRVQEAFDKAGIVYETPADMIRMMWWKFMINVGMNQASAVMGAPYGVFQTSSEAQDLMESLMNEVIAVANAMDVDLTNRDIEDWYLFLKVLSPQGKTSMLQDIEAGRKTEVEIFGKKVVELGMAKGVPTPVNQALLQIITVLERYPIIN
ncbi:MAG: ketopantoate reductase family protein [Proteobacteria bacterium]|nr:ketopantoate reductase family protein [Desulfobacula sp.]MBU3953692.1 ketopantoate reductase family protein [Pseudomonadota bacterium]MBU4133281.1 ketopantoate reductase family protein [Pseudomonadota bacterium]